MTPIGFTALALAVLAPGARLQPSCSLPPLGGADSLRPAVEGLVLRGTSGADRLLGTAGDDWLTGGDGNDVLKGLSGRDRLEGGAGDDVLEGGDDNDVLDGGEGRDFLFGERGDDLLDGGAGPDVLDGGPGNDVLRGGDGDDRLEGCDGDDVIFGGRGNDDIDGSDGIDVLDGGDGDDNLDGGDGNDILLGGAGADSLRGSDGDDELSGGTENDFLSGDDGNDVLRGGAGNDALMGRDGNDLLDGEQGDDYLNGGVGDDILVGGPGVDSLIGGPGNDRLTGGLGSDVLRGDDGNDLLEGDGGDDRLVGGGGTDVVRGGDGNDVIVLRAGDVDSASIEMIDGGTNADTVRVEADTLLLNGFAQSDVRPFRSGDVIGVEILDPLTGGTYLVTRVERVVFQQTIAFLGDGESLIHVVNGSAAALTGRIEFVDGAGRAMATAVGRDTARTNYSLRVSSFGRVDLPVRAPRTGSLQLYTDQMAAVVVRTNLVGGDRGVVTPTRVADAFTIPLMLDRLGGQTSGATIHNGGGATSLLVQLVNAAGQELESRAVDVPAQGQVAFTARDLFPRFDRVDGKIVVEGAQLAAMTVQFRDGRPTTASPLLWSRGASKGPLRLPRIVNGDGQSTRIAIAGVLPDTAKGGRIAFFDQAGKPLAIDLVGRGAVTDVPFTIDDAATLFLETTGSGPRIEASALVTTTSGIVDAAAWLSLGRAGTIEVPAARVYASFFAPVARDASLGTNSQIILVSGPAASTVELTLRDASGARVAGGRVSVSIPRHGHISQTLDRLFPQANLARFTGSLAGNASSGRVAAVLIETGSQSAVAIPVVRSR